MNNLSASAHSANPSIDSRLVQKVADKVENTVCDSFVSLQSKLDNLNSLVAESARSSDIDKLKSFNVDLANKITQCWSVYHIKLSQLSYRSSVILARWSRRVSRTLLELTVDQMKLTGLHLQWIIRSMLLSLGLLRTDSPVNGVGMSTKFWPLLQDGMWRLAMRSARSLVATKETEPYQFW